jgi:hypothetical protein
LERASQKWIGADFLQGHFGWAVHGAEGRHDNTNHRTSGAPVRRPCKQNCLISKAGLWHDLSKAGSWAQQSKISMFVRLTGMPCSFWLMAN